MRVNPKDLEEGSRTISRRALIVGGLQLAFMGMLGLRMRQLQIEEADEYRLLAEENRINMRLIAPPRGVIFDRNGVIIADNSQNYRIIIVREDAGDVDEAHGAAGTRSSRSSDDDTRPVAEKRTEAPQSSFVPVTIADRLTWDDLARALR